MDPRYTFELFLSALRTGNVNDAKEHFYDLKGWLESDGFPPDLNGEELIYVLGKALNHQEMINTLK